MAGLRARMHHLEVFPRQSVGGGKFIQNRLRRRYPHLKTTAIETKSTLGDPSLVTGVVGALQPTPFTPHPTTYTLHQTPYTLHPTLYTLPSTPYTLHPTPCNLHPTPYTLHPTPHTLHPTPYTLHPTPSILYPKSYTLQPKPYTLKQVFGAAASPQSPHAGSSSSLLLFESGPRMAVHSSRHKWPGGLVN